MGKKPLSILLCTIIASTSSFCKKNENVAADKKKRLDIVVSIAPQKYFVERIGGDFVNVIVLVKPEQNHETYEPTPQQLILISKSLVFFRIGVPFESTLIEKIASSNKGLKIIDTRDRVPLRKIESFQHMEKVIHGSFTVPSGGETGINEHRHEGERDPHIWLDPLLVKIQAETIYRELAELDPGNGGFYRNNYEKFAKDLDGTDREIKKIFKPLKQRKFVVFHPAWGYFADQYGLIQVPIEFEGKEPGQKELAFIIDFMKKERIKVIFIQKQFNMKSAVTIANAVGGKVIAIDHLSDDYLNNLISIAGIICANME